MAHLNASTGTIEVWFKPRWDGDDGDEHYFFDTDADRMAFYKWSDDKIYFYPNLTDSPSRNQESASALTSSDIAKDTCNHLIVTYDQTADEIIIYLNGEVHPTTKNGTGWTIPTYGTNLYIGSNVSGVSQADATILYFRTWDKVLTATEAKNQYQMGTDLVAAGYNWKDVGKANVIHQGVINLSTNGHSGLLFRRQDGNNQYRVVLDEADDKIYLDEMIAGTWYGAASASATLNASTDYTVRILTLGANVKVYLDGTEKISYSDSTLSSQTKFGIVTLEPDLTSTIDDVEIHGGYS